MCLVHGFGLLGCKRTCLELVAPLANSWKHTFPRKSSCTNKKQDENHETVDVLVS